MRRPDSYNCPLNSSIHVVHFALDEAQDDGALCELLDRNEQFRARQISNDLARRRFETAHGLTRIVLGHWLGVPAGTIAFSGARGGKPTVAAATDLRFNLSHSGAHAVLALAHARETGVDIERMRPIDVLGVARRFLAPGEADALAAMSGDCQSRAFFRCWTRKESYVKARGDGFACPFNQFEVSLDESSTRLIETVGDTDDRCRWTITDVATAPGYAAALTAEGSGWTLQHWVCSPSRELHPYRPATAS